MNRVLQTFVVFFSIIASIVSEHGTHNAVRTPCDHMNGGCSSTCLVSTNERGYSCTCPVGIPLLSDKKTCAHEGHSFLLVTNFDNILKISLDNSKYTVEQLQLAGRDWFGDVNFDPLEGKIYWIDSYSKVIRRAYLNSSGQQDIVSSDLFTPSGIAIDYTARKLYWTDRFNNRIEMSDLNGTNRKVIMRDETAEPLRIVIDPESKRIYWTDFRKHRIDSSLLDGTNRSVVIDTVDENPVSLALDDERKIIYWGYHDNKKIEMANVDGSDRRVLILNDISAITGLSIFDGYIYWTDFGKKVIERADKKTGDNRQVIVDNLSRPGKHKWIILRNIRGKTCDSLVNPRHGYIRETNNSVNSVATFACHLGYRLVGKENATCLWIDNKLQWSNPTPECVKGVKCKGHSFDSYDITYDPELEEEFWTEIEYPTGTRATVTCEDGFEIFPFRPVITNAATAVCVNGQWKPDIANCTAARCSCSKRPQEMIERKRKLKYCEQLVSSGTNDQWTECEEGYQAKGNYGAICGWGVWFIHTPVTRYNRCVRIPTPCDYNNGGCSSTCLVSTNKQGYSCSCPKGIPLLSDKRTCAHEGQSFLLVANGESILMISLDDSNYTALELQLQGLKWVSDIDYDPIQGHVYWLDEESSVIRRAYLNGSGQQNIVSTDLSSSDGIAIDHIARKLYWTDSGKHSIEMSDLNGTNPKVIMRDETAQPSAILVDSEAGRIYWMNLLGSRIESSSLDGTNRSVVIDTNEGRWKEGSLALDNERKIIYFGTPRKKKIEMANVDGSERRVLKSNGIRSIDGLSLIGDYIYWSDKRKKQIVRVHKITGDKIEVIANGLYEHSNLKSIVIQNITGEKCKGLSFDAYNITYEPEPEEDFWTEMEYPNGTRATVTCDDGFEIFPLRPIVTNAATTVCVDGQWKPDIVNCTPARCSCTKLPQEMIERKRKMKYCDQFAPSGTYDQLTECEEGYQARGNYGARCAWGIWSIHTPVTQYNRCIRNKSVKDCHLDLKGKDDLTAVHRNHTFESQEMDFVHRSTVKFSCKSFYSTLEGAKNVTCIDGQWSKEIPKCKRTSGFDFLHPPFLGVYFANFSRINADDGRVMIPKVTLFQIGCWSPEKRQLILNQRNISEKQLLKVNFSSEDMFSSIKVINPVGEKMEATVVCINSKGISTEFNVVIADTCEVDESELNRRGLQVVPDSRQRIYVEGDRIQVECSSNERRTDQFIIICKSGGEWEYANNMDC